MQNQSNAVPGLAVNATEFKQEIRVAGKAIVPLNDNDFISVKGSTRGYDCRLVRSLEADSDASELVAEYSAGNFTDILRLANEALSEYRGATICYEGDGSRPESTRPARPRG